MSIVEIQGGRITHQYLMRKSKSELAHMVLDYLAEIERRSWVHCMDRLPKESDAYLVTLEFDNESVLRVDIGSFAEPIDTWEKAATVYAWQPLPKPYRPDYI